MENLLKDLRYAGRMMAKAPGFTATAVAVLGLGIGANSTIFSLVNAVLLRPLPVAEPDRVAAVFTSDHSGPPFGTSSYPDYEVFREHGQAFAGLAAYESTPVHLTDGAETVRLLGEMVSANYFDVVGRALLRGRGFLPEEDAPGAHPVVVISQGLWQRRFGGDPGLLGRGLALNGEPFTVVGVAPEGFTGVTRGFMVDAWVPLAAEELIMRRPRRLHERGHRSLLLLGRLKPGQTVAQAQAGMDVLARRLHGEYPNNWTDVNKRPRRVTVVPESEARIYPGLRGPVLGFMAVLLVVVGLVLLIACANVAGLLVARAAARSREMAVRLSLGASRRRLLRQLLTESVVLALVAGLAGLLLAAWVSGLLMAFRPPLPVPVALELTLDGRVLGFTLSVAVLTGLIFGLLPALQAARGDVVRALKDEAGTGTRARRSRLRSGLVVAQNALSVLLLVGSALFLRSLRNASTIDHGFDPEGVVLFSFDLRLHGYAEEQGRSFYPRLLEQVRSTPGVRGASVAARVPLGLARRRSSVAIEGYTPSPNEDREVHNNVVGPGYFETMRIPIVRGRGFTDADQASGAAVAVVNEAFVRRYWPGQDPLGKRIYWGRADGPTLEVVGVTRDGKYVTLGEEPTPYFYRPILQKYESAGTLIVRGGGDPRALVAAIRAQVQAVDKTLPLFDVKTLGEHMGYALLPARLAGGLLGAFGLLALALAAVGTYGLLSYTVSQRTREIGVRMALGARSADVLRLVVRQGMVLTGLGMAVGVAAALGVTRFLSALLYGVSPTDLFSFAGPIVVLAAAALLACYVPARRGARIDPMVALRYE